MKRIFIISTTALAGLAMLAGAAFANQDDREGGKRRGMGPKIDFAAMDTDNDGKITQAELDAFQAARFNEADTNNDGLLSAEELEAQHEARKAERETRKGEMRKKGMAKMMTRMDANKDGSLSQDEMKPMGSKGGGMIERLDTDGDGAISKEELEAGGKKRHGKKRGHGDKPESN